MSARRALVLNLDFDDFVYSYLFERALLRACRERGLDLDLVSTDPLIGRDLRWELGIPIEREEYGHYFPGYDRVAILSAIDALGRRHRYDALFVNCRAPLFAELLRRPTFETMPWIVYDRHLHEQAPLVLEDVGLRATLAKRRIHGFVLEWTELLGRHLRFPFARTSLTPWPMDHEFFAPVPHEPNAPPVVFSGGDSGRDYACLIEATRGLNVAVRLASSFRSDMPRLPLHEFRDQMRSADLVVVPLSGNPRVSGITVIVMAQFVSVPVIATDITATRQCIAEDENGGWLVPPGDPRALSEKIAALLADRAAARRVAESAHRHVVETASLRRLTTRMLDAFEAF